MRSLFAALLFASCSSPAPPASRSAPVPPEAVEVMILGTYHFDNPGLDVIKMDVPDILSEAKQREVAEVVTRLAVFKPTVVAVEALPGRQRQLDSLYAAYRGGTHALEASEVQQLGFRLADRLDLDGVRAVDYALGLPHGAYSRARESLPAPRQAEYDAFIERLIAEDDSLQQHATLREILRVDNDPERIARIHQTFYVNGLSAGAGGGFEGAEYTAAWTERNLKIFANIAATAQPGDRVLLVIGAGHAYLLRDLVRQAPWMRLAEPRDVL